MTEDDQSAESYLDKEFLEKLQAQIIEDARKIYSEKMIELWLNPPASAEISCRYR